LFVGVALGNKRLLVSGIRIEEFKMHFCRWVCGFFAVAAAIGSPVVAEQFPFVQKQDAVYGEVDGVGLLMDVFSPTGTANGLAIIDVASGAWHSDRAKIREHMLAQTFHILCRKGYTVFAVRPGSLNRFSALEMVANVNEGIRWVKRHAGEYHIDPARLGLMGASAGGHLACLSAVTGSSEGSDKSAADAASARVAAVAVFFPPTDFLDYGGRRLGTNGDGRWPQILRQLAFPRGVAGATAGETEEQIARISPARQVTANAPPFLLIHGDADPIVPLQQSQLMAGALKKAGVPAKLVVKKGGGHPWLTIHEEVQVIADWFDQQLEANKRSEE
jgi:acetyl esterase/lipase